MWYMFRINRFLGFALRECPSIHPFKSHFIMPVVYETEIFKALITTNIGPLMCRVGHFPIKTNDSVWWLTLNYLTDILNETVLYINFMQWYTLTRKIVMIPIVFSKNSRAQCAVISTIAHWTWLQACQVACWSSGRYVSSPGTYW